MNQEKNKALNLVILIVGIILFLALFLLMRTLPTETATAYKGVISQIQVAISTVLVMTNHKRGYFAACALELFPALSSLIKIVNGTASRYSTTGVMIPACAIILMSLIFFYLTRSEKQHDQLLEQYEAIMDTKRIMQEKNEALQELAYTDRLTGMQNKRSFCKQIEEDIQQDKPFSIIYFDLDDFKKINDTFGPKSGDSALKMYADRITAFCNRRYFCARLSSDEFGILLTGKQNETEMLNIIEQLRLTINKEINLHTNTLSLTASYGIVSYPNDGKTSETLLEHAEMAFYNAKASGKNKACFFSRV